MMLPNIPPFQYSIMISLQTYFIDFFPKNVMFSSKIPDRFLTAQKMIGNKIGHRLDPYLYSILKKFLGEHGNPNLFTFMGFFATLVASFFILKGFWFLAGLAIILSGLFDLFDGVVARKLGKVTAFGSFLDSVLDRYSDLLLLLALLIYYLKKKIPVSSSLLLLSAWARFLSPILEPRQSRYKSHAPLGSWKERNESFFSL